MTKSIQKAINGSVAVAIKGETHYITADKLLLGDKTLNEVLETIESNFNAKIKALETEFDNKLMRDKIKLKTLINEVEAKLESLDTHYKETLKQLVSVGD